MVNTGQGDGSVGKVTAGKAWETEFESPAPRWKPGPAACISSPELEGGERQFPGKPDYPKHQVQGSLRDAGSKKERGRRLTLTSTSI